MLGFMYTATRIALITLIVPFAAAQAAAPVIPYAQDKPPGPALSPEQARARMTVPDGFRVQLVAAEPDIVNPVAMTFDARGRIWLCESVEYPKREAGAGRDRIKILEDRDRDGAADTFTVFADGLNIPSGIALGRGGVFVANAPDLLFLRDTDGDDVADATEVLLTGFGRHDTHEVPNSLTWGPDGWLYGLNGVFNPADIRHQGRRHQFTCALWRYHPVTKAFELFSEGTSNPWGLAYDHNGSFFVSACVIDHLWHLTQTGYYHRQAGAYPPWVWKIESIVDHRHVKAAYCGLSYYDADAYPAEYRGNLFMGNIHGGQINRDALERDGSTYHAKPKPDFLEANDAWFMPVVQKVGPDGSLYVADWYDRYHCYQDANRDPDGIDRDKGRIWRIVYGDTRWPEPFDVEQFASARLVETLAHSNVWWRREAQRVLTERADVKVTPALQELALGDHKANRAARHALWTLISTGPLDEPFHVRVLDHDDPIVRAWGVRAAAGMQRVGSRVRERIDQLAGDPSPDVRLQVAVAAGKRDTSDGFNLLRTIMEHPQQDSLLPHIVWRNLQPMLDDQAKRMTDWLAAASLDKQPIAAALAGRITEYLLTSESRDIDAFAALLQSSLNGNDDLRSACLNVMLRAVDDGALTDEEQATLRAKSQSQLRTLFEGDGQFHDTSAALLARWRDPAGIIAARAVLANAQKPWTARRDAVRALVLADGDRVLEPVRTILTTAAPVELQHACVSALGLSSSPKVGSMLVAAWPKLADRIKPLAADLLARRAVWAAALLDALENKTIPTTAVNANQARQILGFNDERLAKQLTRVWGTLRQGRDPEREKLVARMRRVVERGKGDPIAGQQIYIQRCAQCHKLYDYGADVGPDLTGVGRTDLDQLLTNVLDPNLVIGSGYQSQLVLTRADEVLTGLLVEDSDRRVVLKTNGGATITIGRKDIVEMKEAEVSLMPEGLEKDLSDQGFRDLIALLRTHRSPAEWPDVEPVITP